MFSDLREFIGTVEKADKLKRIEGADWNLELGALMEMLCGPDGPMLLFDKIKGYPEGYRVACRPFAWIKEFPLAIGVGPELKTTLRQKWQDLFES